ncbi:hypothetical protein [Phytoactinopolyspora alkaliphila]|uniref:hypothetical protein n=1 Tax=Phytoactinopolyspora alkaliphila TaxID=1783498 RepID=UPI0013CF412A|nr:hypothetical protein [Phytoactinopolyspora alkaliphila]
MVTGSAPGPGGSSDGSGVEAWGDVAGPDAEAGPDAVGSVVEVGPDAGDGGVSGLGVVSVPSPAPAHPAAIAPETRKAVSVAARCLDR